MNAEDVILEVSHLEKSFGSHDVLRDISEKISQIQRSMYRHIVLRLEWYSRVLICLTT